MSESWDEKSAWMRKVGAVQCGWNDSGDITQLVLGPAPVEPVEPSVFEEEDRAREEIAARRALLFAAASGAKYRATGARR